MPVDGSVRGALTACNSQGIRLMQVMACAGSLLWATPPSASHHCTGTSGLFPSFLPLRPSCADLFFSDFPWISSDVKRFLEPYAPHYRIFNLCPLYENSYEATAFAGPPDGDEDEDSELRAEEQVLGGPVERYPWPDHHPPPLSLMRVMVEGARRWYLQDERNVVVIHCKVRDAFEAASAPSFCSF